MSESAVAVEEHEYHEACDSYMGWCTCCQDFTRGCTEPDACNYDCEECGENTVFGAEEALLQGLIRIA